MTNYAKKLINLGAGEIINHENHIDREGIFKGYNLEILNEFKNLSVPVVVMGGCKSVNNMKEAIANGADAIAAGSIFVYRNNAPKSIMINYPKA